MIDEDTLIYSSLFLYRGEKSFLNVERDVILSFSSTNTFRSKTKNQAEKNQCFLFRFQFD